jgi:hypothetical protein
MNTVSIVSTMACRVAGGVEAFGESGSLYDVIFSTDSQLDRIGADATRLSRFKAGNSAELHAKLSALLILTGETSETIESFVDEINGGNKKEASLLSKAAFNEIGNNVMVDGIDYETALFESVQRDFNGWVG